MSSLMAYICKPLADSKMVSFEFSFMNRDNLVNGTEAQFVLKQRGCLLSRHFAIGTADGNTQTF